MTTEVVRSLVNRYWSPEKDIKFITEWYRKHIKNTSDVWREIRAPFIYVSNPDNREAILAERHGENIMNDINATVMCTWELIMACDGPHLRKALVQRDLLREVGKSECLDHMDYIQLGNIVGNWRPARYGIRGPPTCSCLTTKNPHACATCNRRRAIEGRIVGIPVQA